MVIMFNNVHFGRFVISLFSADFYMLFRLLFAPFPQIDHLRSFVVFRFVMGFADNVIGKCERFYFLSVVMFAQIHSHRFISSFLLQWSLIYFPLIKCEFLYFLSVLSDD